MIDKQILERLKTEAGFAGDMEQVALCDKALAGDREAYLECKRVCEEVQANGSKPRVRLPRR